MQITPVGVVLVVKILLFLCHNFFIYWSIRAKCGGGGTIKFSFTTIIKILLHIQGYYRATPKNKHAAVSLPKNQIFFIEKPLKVGEDKIKKKVFTSSQSCFSTKNR